MYGLSPDKKTPPLQAGVNDLYECKISMSDLGHRLML